MKTNGIEMTHKNSTEVKSPSAATNNAGDADDDGFDSLLSAVGFGLWQIPCIFMVIIVALVLPVNLVGVSLLSPPVHFRCFADPTHALHRDPSDNSTWFNDACLSVDDVVGVEGTAADDQTATNSTLPLEVHATGMVSCPYVQYDTSIFTSSIFTQFHLPCERTNLLASYQISYNIGGMFGSTIGGHIGDRFGRLTVVKIGGVLNCVGTVLMLLAPSYTLVLVARLILGATTMGSLIAAWNMALESTPARNRSLVGMLMGTPYSSFIIVFATVGYFIRDWQTLFLISASPVFVLIPFTFFVDESPRWLLQQGRGKKGLKIMEKAMAKNKAKLQESLSSIIDKILQTNGSNVSNNERKEMVCLEHIHDGGKQMWQYLKNPGMRVILICTPIIWFLHSLLYLGVAINANNFTSTNPFLYVGLTGVMDGASILLATPLTTCLGRKVLVGGGLLLSGVLLLVDLLVPIDYYWIKWILVMTGFFLCAGSFQVNYIYAPELFPTAARNRGTAFVNMIGSVGFLCAPLITTILARYTWWAASVIFGCSGIVASLLVPLLPETNNKPMPETLKDVERRWRASRGGRKKMAGSDNTGFISGDKTMI